MSNRLKRIPNLFARISAPYSDLQTAIDKIAKSSERMIVYEHNERADNIHIHFYIEGNTVSTDTIKNYLKSTGFDPGERGRNWSFKSADTDGCVTYMTKGKLDPVFNYNFTTDDIEKYKSLWVDKSNKTNLTYQTKLQYIVRETPSQAKKRKNELLDEMKLELTSHKPVNLEYYVDEKVVRAIIKVLNDNNIIFSRYTIRDYYDTLCSRLYTESFVDSVCKFLSPKN